METIRYDVSLRCNSLPDPDAEIDHPPYFKTYQDALTWITSHIQAGQCAIIEGQCIHFYTDTLQWKQRLACYVAVPTMPGCFNLTRV